MDIPDSHMTLAMVEEVVSQFEWPAAYALEDDLPDGVAMAFPRCDLYFAAGFEGEVEIKFLPSDTGLDRSLTMTEALLALGAAPSGPDLGLIDDRSPHASPEKVRNGLHDRCKVVLRHFRPCLLGDFGWVEAYKARCAARERGR